jgi:hypothetical protein
MVKTMNKRSKTSTLKGGRGKGTGRSDIPKPGAVDFSTLSCSVPSCTGVFTTRQIKNSTITQSATVPLLVGISFALQDLDQSATFVAMFDEYRIDAVTLSFLPTNDGIGMFTNAASTLPPLFTVIDYNDAASPGSTGELRQYDNCMMLSPGRSGRRTFKPRVATAVYNGAFTGYAIMPDCWIDTSTANVQHYGYKYSLAAGTAGQTQLLEWTVVTEYFVSFRKTT